MLSGTVVDRNSIIFCLKEHLKEMIDPDFGLPAKLMNLEVFKDADRQNVKSRHSLQKRNDVLLNIVLSKDEHAHRLFMASLHDTGQQHVLNYINCDGGKLRPVCWHY